MNIIIGYTFDVKKVEYIYVYIVFLFDGPFFKIERYFNKEKLNMV